MPRPRNTSFIHIPPTPAPVTSSDPPIGIECSVCLEAITVTTRGGMVNCSHVFHRRCIDTWHARRRNRGQTPNCPLCRVAGPAAVPEWPVYQFTRSLRGPWGSVTIAPELLIVHAQYWFSQPTKQLIRYPDIASYYRNRNTIFLADASGALLTSFTVRKPDELFVALGTAAIKNYERHGVQNRRWAASARGPGPAIGAR
jgi:hypothetical protein